MGQPIRRGLDWLVACPIRCVIVPFNAQYLILIVQDREVQLSCALDVNNTAGRKNPTPRPAIDVQKAKFGPGHYHNTGSVEWLIDLDNDNDNQESASVSPDSLFPHAPTPVPSPAASPVTSPTYTPGPTPLPSRSTSPAQESEEVPLPFTQAVKKESPLHISSGISTVQAPESLTAFVRNGGRKAPSTPRDDPRPKR